MEDFVGEGLPTREEVLERIRTATGPIGVRDLSRIFNLKGAQRRWLRDLLKSLEDEGALERQGGRKVAPPMSLPAVSVIDIVGPDADGELIARPAKWDSEEPAPLIYVNPGSRHQGELGERVRLLARLNRNEDGTYNAAVIRVLADAPPRVVGKVERISGGFAFIVPADKRLKSDFMAKVTDLGEAEEGDVVVGELLPRSMRHQRMVRVIEVLGRADDPRAASLLAIHEQGIPVDFPQEALDQAAEAEPPGMDGREDLRTIPLVTIDGLDARDFDDAVFAEPTEEGWHLIVAIADVAYYVRQGSPLDKAAYERGNSCYFPDRVVPMLPERLSNDLCSLRPDEDRPCLAAHMWIDGNGKLKRHKFVRAMMRSAARLVYEQVQEAADGNPDEKTASLMETVIKPLYEAFKILQKARDRRGTLDLDLPERVVKMSPEGKIATIGTRARLDSHRLVEEFMILANVSAAEALEAKEAPCVYRVHDQPSEDRLDGLRQMLDSFGYSLATGSLKPSNFRHILERAEDKPEKVLINESVLRCQAQAVYAPENIGHFGLALHRYAHFTSPIRRYADLIVHRSLIKAYRLGEGELITAHLALEEACDHISKTERRAIAAERDAANRYVAAYLADKVGARFAGRISSVTRFGCFVVLDETGADGLVPMSTLPDDYYVHDEQRHALIGRRHHRVYRLGARVEVTLLEADGLSGSTLFRIENPDGADLPYAPITNFDVLNDGGSRHRRMMDKRANMKKARSVSKARKEGQSGKNKGPRKGPGKR
jgi:ribonuclease R